MTNPKIKLRHDRRIPTGYVIGRFDPGHGDEQLISLRDLARMVAAANGKPTVSQAGFGFFEEGLMLDNEIIGTGVFSKNVQFPSSYVPSVATAQTPAASNAVFNVKVGGTVIATITFLAGSTLGTIAWSGGSHLLTAGTIFSLHAPSPADANLGWVTGLVQGDVP